MRAAREVTLRCLGAVQFLTVIPIPMQTVPYEEAMVFFPLVGAMLGLLLASVLLGLLQLGLGAGAAAAVALAVYLLATGLLHEDGLADVADGIRAGRSSERMLEIMRDSRIGTYGGVALVAAFLIRWQALEDLAVLQPWFVVGVAVAAGVLSRSALVMLAAISRPAGSGMAASVVGRVPGWTLLLVGLQASVAAAFAGWRGTALLLIGGALVLFLLRVWFHARLRGVTGDCLGASAVVMECYVLLVGACLKSF